MEENSLVSVIVPIYNDEKFLKKCLDSILCQDYENFELILVDDGSSDKSGEICDNFAEKDRKIIVIHKSNEGVSKARNTGLAYAKGEYICFVDGDDYVSKNYISYLYRLINENNADISLTTENFTTFDNRQIFIDKHKCISGEKAALKMQYCNYPIGVYCKLFKKFLLDKPIRFIENICVGEGFNFNVEALCNAKKVSVGHQKIYTYRLNNSTSVMTKFNLERCRNGLDAIKIMRERLLIKTPEMLKANDYALWRTYGSSYSWIIKANVKKQYPDFYIECYKYINKNKKLRWLFASTTVKEKILMLSQYIHPSFPIKLKNVRYFILSHLFH